MTVKIWGKTLLVYKWCILKEVCIILFYFIFVFVIEMYLGFTAMVESGMQVTDMKLGKIISMVGGDGGFSYQRMGVLQASAIKRLEPLMAEAVKQMSLPKQGPLHIADFGCSTGRNSISYTNFIVKCIIDRYLEADENNGHVTCMPEMLVSFMDLPGNDFNNLVQLLASEAKNAKDLAGSVNGANVGRASNYFSAMMGGSFYNRLLPKESMHFVISTFSLHWMSQVN